MDGSTPSLEAPSSGESAPVADPPTAAASPVAGNRFTAAPYRGDQYRSRRVRDLDDFQLWDLDPRELAWLLSHQREVLTRDIETASEPGGGLRLVRVREGSFGDRRGLRPGDILQEINGQELDGPFDVEDFLVDPAYAGARGWRVRLLREGRPLTMDYRAGS